MLDTEIMSVTNIDPFQENPMTSSIVFEGKILIERERVTVQTEVS